MSALSAYMTIARTFRWSGWRRGWPSCAVLRFCIQNKDAALSVSHDHYAHVQVERVAPRVAAMRAACKKQERDVATLTAQLRAAGIQPLVSPCASRCLPYLPYTLMLCALIGSVGYPAGKACARTHGMHELPVVISVAILGVLDPGERGCSVCENAAHCCDGGSWPRPESACEARDSTTMTVAAEAAEAQAV